MTSHIIWRQPPMNHDMHIEPSLHPDAGLLYSFLTDQLSQDRAHDIAQHIDHCTACQTELDRLCESSGTFAGILRELQSAELLSADDHRRSR